MKTSQIVAKIVTRLFFILLLISAVPFVMGDNTKLQHFNFVVREKWTLIFPAILLAGFITFFVSCTINKYKSVDMNWLLVVNSIVLIVYLGAIAFRVYQAVG